MFRDSLTDFLSLEMSAQAVEVFLMPYLPVGIRSCIWVSIFLCSSLVGFFGILFVPKGSLVSQGSETLGGTTTRLLEISWEVLSIPYCFVIQQQRRCIGISSLISNWLTLVAVFSFYYIEEERIQ